MYARNVKFTTTENDQEILNIPEDSTVKKIFKAMSGCPFGRPLKFYAYIIFHFSVFEKLS